ncbi:methyl-accepting chemotaxis protein [Halalkalibacter urbisdiaboli]|uniref:methyl-accepting chemotaxis protein n=1 Tax=Halalkalibacter urbisdiaboli TaxID=1960589 RepID=UPI000B436AB2|nr:HAMP domain-containing methyl-accepting chemotaxis protein [Halalkalibacter urbisdiaboli]
MNIRRKLLCSFITTLISLGIITYFTNSAFSSIDEYLVINSETNEKIKQFNEMENALFDLNLTMTKYIVKTDSNLNVKSEELNQQFHKHANKLLALGIDNATRSKIEQFIRLEGQLYQIAQEMTVIQEKDYTMVTEQSSVLIADAMELANQIRDIHQSDLDNTQSALVFMTQFSNKVITAISILAFFVGLFMTWYISKIISKPLKQIAVAADEISNGNLLIKEVNVKNSDEIGHLASSFNKMLHNLRLLIANVKDTSNQVAASSEQLITSAEKTSSSSSQVTTALQEVASGSEIQGGAVEDTEKAINDLSKGVNRIISTASSLTEATSTASNQCNLGNDMLKEVTKQMNTINSSTAETNQLIIELDNNSQRIGEIINAITEIAEQTNLLALNASIESARAGEHGKGFAVVANEVRKLAEQSRNSANQISSIVNFIRDDIFKAVKMTKISLDQVKEGLSLVEDTGRSFGNILIAVENVNGEIQVLSALSTRMSSNMEDVHVSIKEVASVAQSASLNTADIAASSEEQLATMEEVNLSAINLAEVAKELKTQINKFKLEV